MPSVATIFWAFVFPSLLVATGAFLFRRKPSILAAIFPLLIAIGFSIAYAAIHQLSPFSGTDIVQKAIWFTLAIAILSTIDILAHPPAWLRAIALLLIWRVAIRALLGGLVPENLSADALELWIDITSIAVLLNWLTLENISRRDPGASVPLVLGILALAIGILIFTTLHIQREGMLAIALGLVAGASAIIGRFATLIPFSRGPSQTILFALFMLLVFSWFFATDTPGSNLQIRAALLLASPMLAFVGDIKILRQSPRRRLLIRVIAVALLAGTLSALSIRDFIHNEQAAQQAAEE